MLIGRWAWTSKSSRASIKVNKVDLNHLEHPGIRQLVWDRFAVHLFDTVFFFFKVWTGMVLFQVTLGYAVKDDGRGPKNMDYGQISQLHRGT